jgi:hypothetical protein
MLERWNTGHIALQQKKRASRLAAALHHLGAASTHYCWKISRDSRAEPFVWTGTRALQGRGRITQL